MGSSKFHVLMFPWLATGHMTPFLYLANSLAEKGHRVTYFLPKKALKQLEHLNLFPDKIVFHSVTLPHVDGLPVGTETVSDIPSSLEPLLLSAFDLLRDQVADVVRAEQTDVIFFDFAHWIPQVAREFGIKTVMYSVVSASTIAGLLVPELGVPSSKVELPKQDAYSMKPIISTGPNFFERVTTSIFNCHVIGLRTVREVESNFCDSIREHSNKKVILTGTMFPKPDETRELEEQWSKWLNGFDSIKLSSSIWLCFSIMCFLVVWFSLCIASCFVLWY